MFNYNFLYLLSPLHTGGTTQSGNLVGIARESHTNFPYIPSSSIRGRIRASVEDDELKAKLFGTELPSSTSSGEDTEKFTGFKTGLYLDRRRFDSLDTYCFSISWRSLDFIANAIKTLGKV